MLRYRAKIVELARDKPAFKNEKRYKENNRGSF